MKTARLRRRIISTAVLSAGYAVSGNHLFTRADHEAIGRGAWRQSVSEAPHRHPERMVRAAGLLQRTF